MTEAEDGIRTVKHSNLAAGILLGFGSWTVTSAIRRTRKAKTPLKSLFIIMIWGEILANVAMGLMAWLVINQTVNTGTPYNIVVTFFWVCQIQFYFQILLNRVAIIAADPVVVKRLKWGTFIIITLVNISVYLIWVPSQIQPPRFPALVRINQWWDRGTKVLTCLLDISLNYYFLYCVKQQLVSFHGLTKYRPLINCNAWLMLLSIAMDVLVIVVESVPTEVNSIIYQQFQPITYMVKLQIELSLASLIAKIASNRHTTGNDVWPPPLEILQNYQVKGGAMMPLDIGAAEMGFVPEAHSSPLRINTLSTVGGDTSSLHSMEEITSRTGLREKGD